MAFLSLDNFLFIESVYRIIAIEILKNVILQICGIILDRTLLVVFCLQPIIHGRTFL